MIKADKKRHPTKEKGDGNVQCDPTAVDADFETLGRSFGSNTRRKCGCQSIALPAISAGIFGFPKDRCAAILLDTARQFCEEHPDSPLREIRFVLFDEPTFQAFVDAFDARFASHG